MLAIFSVFATSLVGGCFGPIGARPLPFFGYSVPSGQFILLWIAAFAACLAFPALLPARMSERSSFLIILFTGIACRLALLPHSESDDIYRYLWEGKVIHAGFNPYLHAPTSEILIALKASDPFVGRVNHPEMTAVYAPGSLLLFSLVGWISYTVTAMKSAVIFFDLGAVLFLAGILKEKKHSQRNLALYALNPVVLYAFSGQGHLDSIQVFFITAALYFHLKGKHPLVFLAAGAAVQVKYAPLVLFPFLLTRENLKYSMLFIATSLGPFLFFIDQGANGIFTSLLTFGNSFAFNGPLHSLFRAVTGNIEQSTKICKILLAGSLTFVLFRFHPIRNDRKDPIPAFFAVFTVLILFAPTVHFWYLTWLTPFLAIYYHRSHLILHACCVFSLTAAGIAWFTPGKWELPVWAFLLHWLPFLVLFIREIRLFLKRSTVPFPTSKTISVIIPTKNEAANIADCIHAFSGAPCMKEIIVVDAGSSDNTSRIAEQAGAFVLTNNKPLENGGGRGGQILSGINASKGDTIVILHADTRLSSEDLTFLPDFLHANPDIVGGAIGAEFSGSGLRLRIIEIFNDLRAAYAEIAFGDQVQFFRREPIMETSGYNGIPLMEDVELSLSLQETGKTAFLWKRATVSSIKWENQGFSRTILVLRLVFLYLFKRFFTKPDVVSMYKNYYSSSANKQTAEK